MNQLFSTEWMAAFKDEWNRTPQIYVPLQKAEFTARIGYGYKGETRARGMLSIVNGMAQEARAMDDLDLDLDWDLRASQKDWASWIESGFGLTKLGPAIATNSLEFARGNYRQMIKNLSLSQPFLQHFQLMKKLKL